MRANKLSRGGFEAKLQSLRMRTTPSFPFGKSLLTVTNRP